ncbi:11557_t:CDS:2, partial [Ambispora gerdemannii]
DYEDYQIKMEADLKKLREETETGNPNPQNQVELGTQIEEKIQSQTEEEKLLLSEAIKESERKFNEIFEANKNEINGQNEEEIVHRLEIEREIRLTMQELEKAKNNYRNLLASEMADKQEEIRRKSKLKSNLEAKKNELEKAVRQITQLEAKLETTRSLLESYQDLTKDNNQKNAELEKKLKDEVRETSEEQKEIITLDLGKKQTEKIKNLEIENEELTRKEDELSRTLITLQELKEQLDRENENLRDELEENLPQKKYSCFLYKKLSKERKNNLNKNSEVRELKVKIAFLNSQHQVADSQINNLITQLAATRQTLTTTEGAQDILARIVVENHEELQVSQTLNISQNINLTQAQNDLQREQAINSTQLARINALIKQINIFRGRYQQERAINLAISIDLQQERKEKEQLESELKALLITLQHTARDSDNYREGN